MKPITADAEHRHLVDVALRVPKRSYFANLGLTKIARAVSLSMPRMWSFALRALGALASNPVLGQRLNAWVSASVVPRVAVLAGVIDRSDLDEVATSIRVSPLAMEILTHRKHAETDDVRRVLEHIAKLPRPLTQPSAIWFRNQTQFDEHLARTVFNALVLDGAAALGRDLLDLVLLQVPRVAAKFTEVEALQVANKLWPLASAPYDPYDPGASKPNAASALIQLAALRPEVEVDLTKRFGSVSGLQRAALLDILASSVRSKGQSAPESFLKLQATIVLSPTEADRFAEIAETARRTSPDANMTAVDLSVSWPFTLRKVAILLLALFPGPSVLGYVLIANPAAPKWLVNLHISDVPLEGAIAVVALIATVNVFTVQLSMQRLPGTVARAAAQPQTLLGAYAAAFILLLCTAFTPDSRPALWNPMQAALLILSLVWLGWALTRNVRKTDSAEACRSYVDQNIGRWKRAGRTFGQAQFYALQLQKSVESLPFASLGMAAMVGHDVVRMETKSRGIFLPRRAETKRALADPMFANGGHLQFANSFGLVVAAGQVAGLVRPPAGSTVPAALRKNLERMFKPTNAAAVEDVSTQAVTLASLAVSTGRTGDVRLAEAIAEQASRLITAHIGSIQRARRRAENSFKQPKSAHAPGSRGSETYAVSPMLRDVLELLAVDTRGTHQSASRVANIILDGCLRASGPAEHAPVIVSSTLTAIELDSHHPDTIARWLRKAGVRTLELQQRGAFGIVVRGLRRVADRPGFQTACIRSLASLASTCVRLEPREFQTVWPEIQSWSTKSLSPTEPTRIAMQVGASALESGAFSAALICGRSIVDAGDLDVLKRLTNYDNVFGEATAAGVMDAYLGPIPTDSLERFRDFAASI